jgi:WD repeat-containing protein 61
MYPPIIVCSSQGAHAQFVFRLLFARTNTSSADKTAKIWDLGSRAAVSTVREAAGGGDVWAVRWRPVGPTAGGPAGGAWVSGGDDGVVRWWRAAG